MNRFVYSAVLYLLSPLILLYFVFRGAKSADYRSRLLERFGLGQLTQTDLLVHSVSMGETLAAIPLIRQIMKVNPQLRVTVTTTSPTGSAEVIKAFGSQVQHCYLPLDFPLCVSHFLKKLQPSACMIMETELWPNLIHQLKARGTNIMLANARLSAKSAANYQKRARLVTPMLQCLDVVAVQTAQEAQRFQSLGVESQKIHVCGSLKFDIQIQAEVITRAKSLRADWSKLTAPVWIAGSVHPGEFAAVLDAHQRLLESRSDALLIMVPRHPEQFDAAAKAVENAGLNYARRSRGETLTSTTQVLLGDTMGELLLFYAAGDQAFVGGTLIDNGGHNPLEPAALGLPVYVGPNHWDFAEITNLLREAGALSVEHSGDELGQALVNTFERPELLQAAKLAGLAVVRANVGALEKQAQLYESMT